MLIAQKIFHNTAWQIIFRLGELVVGIVSLGLITRFLGQSEYGYYTTIMAWLQLVSITIDFGLYLTLLREIATVDGKEEQRIVSNVFTLRLVSATVLFLVGIAAIWLFPYPLEIKLGVAALSLSYFFVSLITVLTAVFQKNLTMPRLAVGSLISKIAFLVLIFYQVAHQGSLQTILYSASLASGLWFILAFWSVRSYVKVHLAFDWQYWKKILIITWPLAVTTSLNLIYFKLDTVFLSLYQPASAVGIYGAAYRVLEIMTTFPHMFMGLLLPLMTAAWIGKQPEELAKIWNKAFDLFSLITLPLIAGGIVVATPLMSLVAGDDFAASGPVLKILLLATGIIFYGTLGTYLVLTLGRQKQIIKYFLLAAIMSVVGYWWLIPQYSYWAAAWVTVIVEASIIFFCWLVTRRDIRIRPHWLTFSKMLLASIFMALLISLMPTLHITIRVVIGGLIYLILLFAFRALRWSEIKSLIQVSHDQSEHS